MLASSFSTRFCCAKTGAAGRCPHWGQRARSPIFALLKCGPALAPRPSSFSTRFLLRKNRRSRLPAPPFGFAAQKRARHFAARNHPVRLSASRPWLRHPAPLFCRSRHGCAAPGPQRQNPGPCSHSVAFRPAKPGWPVVAPAGGNVLATPFSLRSNVAPHIPAGSAGVRSFVPRLAPRSHPGACSHSVAFRSAKPRSRSSAPPGPMFCRPRHGSAAPGPQRQNPGACSRSVAFRLRRNRAAGRCPRWGQRARYPIFAPLKCGPTLAPRPSSFSIRFFLRKNRRARPPAFGRRGVDKVRKYHFVCVVLSSAPLTLSPLYAPARPVFRNRPKEKAAAETRCGCGISFTFPVFPPMRNKIPRMLCHSHPFNFALIPWGKQKRKARPLSFFALLQKAHFCPFCILSFLCRSRSRCRKADSYSYFAIWYNSSTASCSEPVCFSIK